MNLRPKIALYEPDIPQNTAAIIRTCACLGADLEIIEPCGFLFSDKRFKRVVMDYMDQKMIKFYQNFDHFFKSKKVIISIILLLIPTIYIWFSVNINKLPLDKSIMKTPRNKTKKADSVNSKVTPSWVIRLTKEESNMNPPLNRSKTPIRLAMISLLILYIL